MSVFNRQLFQQGGEVLAVENTLSQTNPEEFTYTLEYREGKPFARKKQTQGFLSKEDRLIPIQTNLSASGNPKEAFDVMRKNALLDAAKTTALTGVGIASLPRTLVSGAISKAAPYVASVGTFANKFLNPVKTSLKPGFAVAGLKGFQARNKFDPMSYQITGANPAGLFFTGSGGAILGTQAAQTTAEDVAQSEEGKKIAAEIAELEKKAGVTGKSSYQTAIKNAIEKAEAGEKQFGDTSYRDQVILLRDKMKELYGEDSPLAEEFLNKPQQKSENIEADKDTPTPEETNQPQPGQERPTEPTEEKETPFLQNKNFLDLMRNIGIKMVETGDLGRGISLGSAEALKEGRAERLLEEERQSELDKIFTEYGLDRRNSLDVARAEAIYEANLVGSAPPDVSDIKNINQLEQDYVASMQSSQNKKYTAKQVEDVIQVLKSSAGQVFGVNNIIQSNFKKIMEFIAGDPTLRGSSSDISEGLKSENPREYIKTILEIVQNQNIQELLGESGRTISNLDRQVVEKIVGQLKDTSVLSQSPKAVATKLQLLYDNLIREAQQDEDKARINANNLTLLGRDPATLITSSEPQEQRRERIRASDYP